MTTFRYKGQTAGGAKVSGVLRAYDEFEAADKLRESVAIITKLEAVPEKKESVLSRPVAFRVKEKELALLCSQFAIILASGLSVERCVSMVAAQTKNKYLRRMLDKVSEEVGAGYSLAQSFENNAPYLPKTFTETLRAGEQSGTLESCFQRLHAYYDRSAKTRAKIVSTLTYPVMVIIVAIVVFVIIIAVAVPAFTDAFTDLGSGSLPGVTRVLMAVSAFFTKWWWLTAGFLSMDAMADFLRQAARDNGIPLTNAAVVLPSTEVFTRELTMPAMTEEDTRVTATLRVDEQAFTLSVPYGTAPTAEDVARLLTDNGISPDTIDSWTPDITQPLYADTAFTAVRKTADSGKSFTDTITLSVDGLDDVSAVFTMAPNYDITIVLHLAGGGDSDCRLVLTLRENKADPTVSTVSGGGRWVRDVTTTTTTISWSPDNATIEKEAVVSKS
ncbi:MAG: type II secretion system F family protein [Oscillospiraceae bacterium]